MKINRFKSFFLLPALFMGITLAGCSNSEDIVDGQTQEGMGSVSFTIKEKNYEPVEEVAGTRAAAPEKPEIQDLGDGWLAEVSLVPDTTHVVEPKAKTRAIYTPTHYTIQAYQGGVKKGELKGTFNGSDFTPDAGQAKFIILPHGTYDFVCFNDKVSANGTQFTVNRADAGTARFTVKRGVVINQDPKQFVDFEMKHAGAQVKGNLVFVNCAMEGVITNVGSFGWYTSITYKPAKSEEALKYTVETLPNKLPETMVYDMSTDSYTYPLMGQDSKSFDVGGTVPGMGSIGDKTSISNDSHYTDYWLPNSDCANLKLTFTYGELYGRDLVGKTIKVPTHKLVEANKRYMIYVQLYMGYMYLYSDGTAGPRSKNPGKTPIGVVIDPAERLAVALNDAPAPSSWGVQWSSTTSQASSDVCLNYKDLLGGLYGRWGQTDYSNLSNSSAIQLALNYYQTVGFGNNSYGITSNPSNVWFVPTLRQFLDMGVNLGRLPYRTMNKDYSRDFEYLIPANAPATGFSGANPTFPAMDMTRFNKAFTDVGGTAPTGVYWTDTECQDGSSFQQAQISVNSTGFGLGLGDKTIPAKVRPFIRY